ncbi:hypothetical protein LWI29_022308 [Acer saccharum]|uniref:Uncharacterized protein n=1 Tax=Acer saccharum TaxID=4024 RepID=A0AA39STM6_ACESA|nr:hypothetical protein LWI29_022308 [Acer saccharum]
MNPNVWLLEIPSITQVTDNKILRQISQLRLFKTTGTAPSRLCHLLGHITNDGVVFGAAFSEHNKSLSMVRTIKSSTKLAATPCLICCSNIDPPYTTRINTGVSRLTTVLLIILRPQWRRTHLVSAGRFCPSKRSNSCLVVMGTLDFNSIIWFQCSDKDWIGVAALLEFTVLFDILLYLNPLGKP